MKTLKRGGSNDGDTITSSKLHDPNTRLTTGNDSPESGQSATDLIYCTLNQRARGCCFALTDCPTAE
jgi:hypothetical protein